MVYKIRNKSLFLTRNGWRNNWEPKILNQPKLSNPETTMAIRCRYDHHSYLRMYQSYRNISRHCKHYFYGDRRLEEIFVLGLRTIFIAPLVSETPTDLIKHGGERRLADQLDRDFELVSHNTHPYQLFTYESNNRYLAKENEDYEVRQAGGKTLEDEMLTYFDQLINAERAKLAEGEELSVERLTDIVLNVLRKARAQQRRPAQDSRGPDGNIQDYLEVRRPFIAPTPNLHTH